MRDLEYFVAAVALTITALGLWLVWHAFAL